MGRKGEQLNGSEDLGEGFKGSREKKTRMMSQGMSVKVRGGESRKKGGSACELENFVRPEGEERAR